MIRRILLVVLALVAVSCSGGDDARKEAAASSSTTSTTAASYTSTVYADASAWLCRPDTHDVCDHDLDATVVDADGTTKTEAFAPAKHAKVDCFYVYPTISRDATANSDMNPGADEEQLVVRLQAARFGSVCDVYAPIYRSATLTALTARLTGKTLPGGSPTMAYDDVVDAWKQYLAHDNHGRGVILIGHSQGSGILQHLLQAEIDPKPEVRKLLVSAMLAGTSAHASDTPHIPPCAKDTDTGCLVTWSTFRSTAPPPANSFFARPKGSEPAVCTNPADLSGGDDVALHPYFGAKSTSLLGGTDTIDWGAPVSNDFVSLPGLVTGHCATKDGFSYFEITVHPSDGPRVDDVRGDLTPEWGMHLIDISVVLGDLVHLAGAQAASYGAHG